MFISHEGIKFNYLNAFNFVNLYETSVNICEINKKNNTGMRKDFTEIHGDFKK